MGITRHATTNARAPASGRGITCKGETMSEKRDLVLAVHYLMNNRHVCRVVSRLHVDANAADVVAHVAPQLSGIDTARPRDIALFFAACVSRHYSNRAAYSVAVRRTA